MAQVIAIFRISINMTSLDGVCVCVWMSGYNMESLSVVHCRVRVREVSRSLDAKERICRFRNRGGALWLLHKIQSFIPTFSVTVKSHWPGLAIPSFISI